MKFLMTLAWIFAPLATIVCGLSLWGSITYHGSLEEKLHAMQGKRAEWPLGLPSFMIAYVCGDPGGCHDRIDGRIDGLPKAEKHALWDLAFKRTVAIWFLDGLVLVA